MDRDTNAKRLWTAYTSNPTKVMTQLENKTKSYEEALFKRSPGIAIKLQKEKQAIISTSWRINDCSKPILVHPLKQTR